MNEKTGEVFSIARDNEPVPGCTTSKAVYQHDAASIVYFSLAAHTDISPETYGYHKLIHVEAGALRVYTSGGDTWELGEGDIILTPTGVPVGMDTQTGCVYTEIEVRKDSTMN